jgi:hypothetical protein
MTFIASVNETALAVFGVVVGVTMIITYLANASPRPPTSGRPGAP